MNGKKRRPGEGEDGAEHSGLLIKTLYSLLAALLAVATALLSVLSLRGVSAIAILGGKVSLIFALFAAVLDVMTLGLALLARGPSDATRVKQQIASAYRAALESSAMNPVTARGEPHG